MQTRELPSVLVCPKSPVSYLTCLGYLLIHPLYPEKCLVWMINSGNLSEKKLAAEANLIKAETF